jgi:hypothetical protein
MEAHDAPIENTQNPLFTIELGPEVGTFAPRSVEELEAWLATEADYWGWLNALVAKDAAAGPPQSRQFSNAGEIEQALRSYKSKPSQELMAQISQFLQRRYGKNRALHSTSPRAKYVKKIAAKEPLVGVATLWAFMGQNPPGTERNGVMGAALAAAYLQDSLLTVESFNEAWADVRKKIAEEHEALRFAAGAAGDEWRRQQDAMTALHETQAADFAEKQASREAEFQAMKAEHAKQVQQIRDTLKNDMALKGSVTYFREKAKGHSIRAGVFAVAALAVAGIVIWITYWLSVSVFTDPLKPPTTPQIGVTLIVGFLVLWLLRILVRILLGNLHLATDMRNRSTLVQTYLALISDGGGIDKEDRAKIVSLVFRPATDGLVRDDGAPPTPGSLLQGFLSGNR